MPKVKEYRILMPLALDEYKIAQLFNSMEYCKNVTGGGDGVEWLENRPFNDKNLMSGRFKSGQYTHRIFHISKKLPTWVLAVLPAKYRLADEFTWNAYPYCITQIKPRLSPEKFNIYIETMHLADNGTTENALHLSPELLAKREIVYIDFVNDEIDPKDYKISEDPAKCRLKSGRGELKPNWKATCANIMCCYKVVHVQCTWTLFGGQIESLIEKQYPKLFLHAHRQLYCSMDRWISLSIEQIRTMEAETVEELRRLRAEGALRGPNIA